MIIYMESTLQLLSNTAAQELINAGRVGELENGVKYLILESYPAI